MSAGKIDKKFSFNRNSLIRYSAWLILVCIFLGSTPVFGNRTDKFGNSVYCPLQKIWVERYVPAVKIENPLENICAADEWKKSFLFELSKKYAARHFNNSIEIEQAFFNYVENGKHAIAGILPSQDNPESPFAKSAAAEKSTGSYKNLSTEKLAEKFILSYKARPPTTAAKAVYRSKTFYKLESISRRIQPRAPPVSL